MLRKPNPRTLTCVFLLFSAGLAVALLAVRNLYDDEIFSLDLVTGPLTKILEVTAEGDVHPPGMYLLAHLAFRLIPSFRWMNLFPALMLYAGLAVFLLQVTPLLRGTRSQICLLLLATLHPQLLMWGATFRWYGWWTGLALIALTAALQPRDPRPTFNAARAVTLGLLLASLFYLNYITFLFAFSLGAAMILRYREQPWKHLLRRAVLTVGVFFALIAPQIRTMLTVHLPMGRAQRYSPAVSVLRLLQSVSASEAYLPWHPLAILADLLFAALVVAGLAALLRLNRRRGFTSPPTGLQPGLQTLQSQASLAPELQPSNAPRLDLALASILLFGLVFFLLVAASGLGGKPRNGVLLIPVLAPAAALSLESLGRTLRPRAQAAALIVFALWSAVGVGHLLGRHGLTKATMNDRPEQVVAFIERTSSQPAPALQPLPRCSVVVTYDSALAFSLAQANLPRLLLISPFRGPVFGGSRSLPDGGCARPHLYVVQSYLGGTAHHIQTFNGELQIATEYIAGPPAIDSFSLDPDASLKRHLSRLPGLGADLASIDRLPDYRYVVVSGLMDRAMLDPMRSRMPHFVSGYELAPD